MRLNYFKRLICGIGIGISIIVPGVSGAIIAMIMNLYENMMDAISNIFKNFKKSFVFLLPIILGIIIGFLIGFILIKILLRRIPFLIICLFAGLMIGSFPIVFNTVEKKFDNTYNICLFIIGLFVPVFVSCLSLFTNFSFVIVKYDFKIYLTFIILGILMALTQIIPGLSATVLLMIFGYYKFLIDNLDLYFYKNFNFMILILAIGIGFFIGILGFSKIINKLLHGNKNQFFHLIMGLALSSIICVFIGNDCIEIYRNWSYEEMIKDILLGIFFLIMGFINSYTLYLKGGKLSEKR